MRGKAIIYTRVSTKEQVTNYSLANQESAVREACKKEGIEVLTTFSDKGESAKTIDRPNFQKMLEYCRKHKNEISCVYVYDISRFARNMYDHASVHTYLQQLGIELKSATQPFDKSAFGKYMQNQLAANEQLDNDIKSEKTIAGMLSALCQVPLFLDRGYSIS